MNPIDKFTNIDAVYPITDAKEEDTLEKPLNFDPFGHAELSLFAKI